MERAVIAELLHHLIDRRCIQPVIPVVVTDGGFNRFLAGCVRLIGGAVSSSTPCKKSGRPGQRSIAAQGFKGGTRGDTEWSQWVRSEKEQLSAVMERHGIEWEDKGTHDKHLSVLDYKKEQRAKEIAALETVKAEKESQVESQERRLKELAPAVKDMERLAADFSADPEEILPEAGTLESAKSYREKKAKPLLAKIVKVLRSLFRKYIDLKGKFDRLQGDYDRVREGNARLSDRLMEVKMENKKLRQISADYTRVKRVFGPEQVEAAVEADKQREQAEKGRKRPRRSLDRGGR